MKRIVQIFGVLLAVILALGSHTSYANHEKTPIINLTNIENVERVIIQFRENIEFMGYIPEMEINKEQNYVTIPKHYVSSPIIKNLLISNKIEYIEPDYRRRVTKSIYQHYTMWDTASINLKAYEDKITGKEEMIVAVIDTGVEREHPDLKGKVLPGYNAIANTSDTNDVHGHGTHVAGITLRASIGAPIKILPVKVLDDEGDGWDSNIAEGIRYATNHGANVINLSLGSSGVSQTMKKAITEAIDQGVFVAVAAGNDGRNLASYYPASEAGAFTVGALNEAEQLADFSNYGNGLDMLAPGVAIYSAITYEGDDDGLKDGYTKWSGTSMATPFIAGIAAKMKSAYPYLTAIELEMLLKIHAKDLYEEGFDAKSGFGKIDLSNFSIDHKGLFFNTSVIKSHAVIEVATYGNGSGVVELYLDGKLHDKKAVHSNEIIGFSMGTIDAAQEEVEVKAIFKDINGSVQSTITKTMKNIEKHQITLEIYNEFDVKINESLMAELFGVKDNKLVSLALQVLGEDGAIDTSFIENKYDSYILNLSNDGVKYPMYLTREVKLDDEVVIFTKDLVKARFDSERFDIALYDKTIEEFLEDMQARLPPLLLISKVYEGIKTPIINGKNLLIDYDYFYVEQGKYTLEYYDTTRNDVYLMKKDILLQEDRKIIAEKDFDSVQIKHDFSKVNLPITQISFTLAQKDMGLTEPKLFKAKENQMMHISKGAYDFQLLVPSVNEGWYNYKKVPQLDINQPSILEWFYNGGEATVRIKPLPLADLVELPILSLPEVDFTKMKPQLLTELTEDTKILPFYTLPNHSVMFTKDGERHDYKESYNAISNEQGYGYFVIDQPLDKNMGYTFITYDLNYSEGGKVNYKVRDQLTYDKKQWPKIVTTTPTKDLTIHFSDNLQEDHIRQDQVVVMNSEGKAISVNVLIMQNRLIISPVAPYNKGEIYTIVLDKELIATTENSLQRNYEFILIVE